MVPQVHVTRKHRVPLVGWRRVPQVHVGWRKDRAETFMTNCKRHGCVTAGPTDTRWMENDPTGARRMEKGPSGRLYDELQASRMNNCRSHSHMSDGEKTVRRLMTK